MTTRPHSLEQAAALAEAIDEDNHHDYPTVRELKRQMRALLKDHEEMKAAA